MILSQLLSDAELRSLDDMRLNHLSYELAKEIQGSDEIKGLLRERVRAAFKGLSQSASSGGISTTSARSVKRK